MAPLAGRDQPTQEGQPQHDLLQVVRAGRHVEAEGPAQGVGEGQDGGREQGGDQEAVLQAPHRQAGRGGGRRGEGALDQARLGRHFPAAAPRCLRNSSR